MNKGLLYTLCNLNKRIVCLWVLTVPDVTPRECVQDSDRFQKCHVRIWSQEAFHIETILQIPRRHHHAWVDLSCGLTLLQRGKILTKTKQYKNKKTGKRKKKTFEGNLNGINFVGADLVVGREGG